VTNVRASKYKFSHPLHLTFHVENTPKGTSFLVQYDSRNFIAYKPYQNIEGAMRNCDIYSSKRWERLGEITRQ